eukprot:PLAT15538.12.p2 GENE.PLAT15538.12~~PLAT15538.12.p2  ORF type:complete len:420 (-),score=168.48 PLAT15538.12:174-1433(-)
MLSRLSSARLLGGRALSAAASVPGMHAVPVAPPDGIFHLNVAFAADESPDKINLGIGAYRDDHGKPFVLPSVREAEKRLMAAQPNHEYAGIAGLPEFASAAVDLIYGEEVSSKHAIAAVQSISGTGALRLGGALLSEFGDGRRIAVSNPTWGNHKALFSHCELDVVDYDYYDPATGGLNFEGMVSSLRGLPAGTTVLLHACAHNPTGVDPTAEQWRELSAVIAESKLLPFFDCAYQGFATGDLEADAFAVRQFAEDGHSMLVAQSFSKNMGLYGERVGAISFTSPDEQLVTAVMSQLKVLARTMYSNPPLYGARLATEILTSPELCAMWKDDCAALSERIKAMRTLLVKELAAAGSTLDWSHVESQIGMFCYSKLNAEQVAELVEKRSIYLTSNGRISVAGITPDNVSYLAKCMHEVTA